MDFTTEKLGDQPEEKPEKKSYKRQDIVIVGAIFAIIVIAFALVKYSSPAYVAANTEIGKATNQQRIYGTAVGEPWPVRTGRDELNVTFTSGSRKDVKLYAEVPLDCGDHIADGSEITVDVLEDDTDGIVLAPVPEGWPKHQRAIVACKKRLPKEVTTDASEE